MTWALLSWLKEPQAHLDSGHGFKEAHLQDRTPRASPAAGLRLDEKTLGLWLGIYTWEECKQCNQKIGWKLQTLNFRTLLWQISTH